MKYPIMRTLVVAAAFTATFAGCGKHAKEPESSENVLTEAETETTPEVESVTEEEPQTEAESDTEETGGVDPEAVAETTGSGANIAGNAGATDNTGTTDTDSGSDSTANLPQTATQPTATPVPKTVTGVSAVANGSYYVGDTLGANDFTVTVLYSDGTYAINPAGYAVAPLTLAGSSNTLTVSYGGVESTFVVNASERPKETEEETTTEGKSEEEIYADLMAIEEKLYGTQWVGSDCDLMYLYYLTIGDDGTGVLKVYDTADDGIRFLSLDYTQNVSLSISNVRVQPSGSNGEYYPKEMVEEWSGGTQYTLRLYGKPIWITYSGDEPTRIKMCYEGEDPFCDSYRRLQEGDYLYDFFNSGLKNMPDDYNGHL